MSAVPTGNVATLGHPADGVVINQSTTTTSTTHTVPSDHTHTHTTHAHNKDNKDHKDHPTNTNKNTNTTPGTTTGTTGAEDTTGTDRIVKTGDYVTGLERHPVNPTPIPVVGESHQNRIVGMAGAAGPAPRQNAGPLHGSVSGAPVGVGGSLGGAVMLGGQCECLMNGGTCSHPVGQCKCRGCSTPATIVNPGQNVGVSDTVDHSAANPHPM